MFKTPVEYAQQMLDLFFGDHDAALQELFEAAKAHPRVPNKFWFDVMSVLHGDKLYGKDGTSSSRFLRPQLRPSPTRDEVQRTPFGEAVHGFKRDLSISPEDAEAMAEELKDKIMRRTGKH